MTTSTSTAASRAVGAQAEAMADPGWVALGGGGDVLLALVDHLDRPTGALGEDRAVGREHRRVLLLAAEPAAGDGLGDDDVVGAAAEQRP
jgi:hypothetical protein